MKMNLRNILNALMTKQKLTGKQLAKDVGITEGTVSKILTGANTNPKIDTIIALAKYFNVSCDYLLGLSDYTTSENTDICEATGLSDEVVILLKKRLEYYAKSEEKNPDSKDFIHEQKVDELKTLNIFIKSIIENSLSEDIFRYSEYLSMITENEKSNDKLSLAIAAYNIHRKFIKLMDRTFDDCTGYKKEQIDEIIEKETGSLVSGLL